MKIRVIILMVGTILLNLMTQSSAQTDRPEWKSRSGEGRPQGRHHREMVRRRFAIDADKDEPRRLTQQIDSDAGAADHGRVRLISLTEAEDTDHSAAGGSNSPHDSEESGSVLPQPLPPVSAGASAAEEDPQPSGNASQRSEPTGNVTIFSDKNRKPRTPSSLSTSEETSSKSPKHETGNVHESSEGADHRQNRMSGRDIDVGSLKQSFVIDGPIDRLGLADNLYLTGELVLALEMYEQIESSAESPEEIFWVRYQAACCLRRLGRTDEAQAGYRRIAEAPEAGWLHELSIWWLDRINERLVLEADLRKLQQLTQDLRENQNVNSSH